MKTYIQNAHNDDTIYVTLQMNEAEYLSLRTYMHAKDGENVRFPYGSEVIKRGYGWYRIEVQRTVRARDKIAFAMKILKMWQREEEERVEAEIKALAPLMMNAELSHVSAWSPAHSTGEYQYQGQREIVERRTEPRAPVSVNKLQELVAAYAYRRHGC